MELAVEELSLISTLRNVNTETLKSSKWSELTVLPFDLDRRDRCRQRCHGTAA